MCDSGLGEYWFGIDIRTRKATFFDDGKRKITSSTWQQCGNALAALLSLPESGASPSLSDWKNKPLYISSFTVSQRDMLDSLHRVMGTKDSDWEIKYEETSTRYKRGKDEMKEGKITGFATQLYTRQFFPDGAGEFGNKRELCNDLLSLPKEELDEATKRTVDMVQSGWNPFEEIVGRTTFAGREISDIAK